MQSTLESNILNIPKGTMTKNEKIIDSNVATLSCKTFLHIEIINMKFRAPT